MTEANYKLFQSEIICSDPEAFVSECVMAHSLFEEKYSKEKGSTWAYTDYNLFVLTAGSLRFYLLYKELCKAIRDYAGYDEPIWMQSWINYHDQDQILDWHNHHWDFHGYISVDPKQSTTEFERWSIKNKTGQIYIGAGGIMHRVVAEEPFDGKRITIGFDCSFDKGAMYRGRHLIPIL